jgi:predicted transcriptional regulator
MWWFKQKRGRRGAQLDPLGSLESELMERIWLGGETSVRDLHRVFSPRLAYTTIMTTLDRLYKKGLLNRNRAGRAYIYSAKVSESEYRAAMTQHLIHLALHDGKHTNAVLSCFVDVVSQADLQMLHELEQLVQAKRRALRRQETPS